MIFGGGRNMGKTAWLGRGTKEDPYYRPLLPGSVRIDVYGDPSSSNYSDGDDRHR